MSGFKHYKRKGLSEMRPYVLGESLDGISISDADKKLPTLEGGYIARNPQNHDDKWYVSKEYHEANLEEALEVAENAVEEAKIFGLTFGQAISALKDGKLVARSGWNGKGMFIFQRPSDKLSVETIVNNVKSLPDSLKKYYQGNFAWTQQEAVDGIGPDKTFVEFTSYYCMKAADGSIVNGWLASQTDMQAEDWQIVE